MYKIKDSILINTRACLFALGRLLSKPFSLILTISIIGICLALPASLFVMLNNAKIVGATWSNNSYQIDLFLKPDLSHNQTNDLIKELKQNPEISNVKYISPKEGLENFANATDTSEILKLLNKNPLPGVIIVEPLLSMHSTLGLQQLIKNLKNKAEIDQVRFDAKWIKRFDGIINLVKTIIFILSFLLGIGIILIIGNTIRSVTQNDRKEISVLKLIGATDAFIRRPLLYLGAFYGLFGGVVAYILVNIILWQLNKAVTKLAIAYNSDFSLTGLNANHSIILFLISILLCLLGTWIVVKKSLIEQKK